MKYSIRKRILPVFLFSVTIIAFFVFFLYMGTAERVSVYHSETRTGYTVLGDMEMELVDDDTAPAGVRKVYRGTLASEASQENVLFFNIAHHNIEVYFGDELVYSLAGADSNRIGKNVCSNWCIVNTGDSHAGKDVTVVLTPLFEAAVSKTPEFFLGSAFVIAMELITGELPLMVLSCISILLGIFVAVVFLGFRFIRKTENPGTIYLGFFSITIGLWKLTDLKCITLLFPEHSMAMGYISVGSLFLTGLCLLLYFSTLFNKDKQILPRFLACVGSLLCLTVLTAQILGIAEIRQNLVYSHILLIVSIGARPVTALLNRIVQKNWGLRRSWRWLLIVFIGIAGDLLYFYRNNGNGLMSFSIMGLIIYTLIIFLQSIQETTRKAYTDSHTDLVNRAHWTEMMNSEHFPEMYAFLMIDMNGLKQANDTLGHDAGDQMIFQLSGILRRTLPRSSVICRWGGDEFAVLLADMDRIQVNQLTDKLFTAGEKYNAEHPELPIHYAIGAVLSSEHPDISRNKLFELADEEMYRNKKEWYAKRNKVNDAIY